jgi:hypothetical protein
VSNDTGGDARVTENDLNKSSNEVWRDTNLSFFFFRISSQQVSNPTIPCLDFDVHCSFQSVSSNTMMPASVSPSPSVNFKTVMILSQAQAQAQA